jgi:predicted nucleic acid-binding protein
MAKSVIVDAGFLIALLSRRDRNHSWAAAQAPHLPPPWIICEAVLSEAFHVVGDEVRSALSRLLRTRAMLCAFHIAEHVTEVLDLMRKYSNIQMSLADACIVRMTEVSADPILLTTDSDFRIYRRHGRKIVPSLLPN